MDPVDTQAAFAQALRDALALPLDDQARLFAVLERVTGAASVQTLPVPVTQRPVTQEPTAAQWLAQLAGLPAWTQLQLLDEAIATTDAPEELALLEPARAQLLRVHPPLAVRRAVVELATRQPIAVCVGSVGLLVGVVGIGRLLVRMMF